ncbi:alpha/beta fold hydrolase [Streptomyces sp. NPDC006879]|uniref:alpha/beta fold hydrolase n=1 Tax=Streptomyces sp. NPDC006879 TaxID=3364767 RepID=UPI003676FA7F
MQIRLPRRRRRLLAAAAAALTLTTGAGIWSTAASDGQAPVRRQDRVAQMPDAGIDTSYFTTLGGGRRPAVLLGHGFGGSKEDVRPQAERLARAGYAVLTWSARGFGASGGRIGLNDPDHEVKDVSRLIDWLAGRPEVQLDSANDPRVAVAGASYGGAVALLAAGHDRRVDVIAPQITYWNLADALFPHGVFKKLWSGIFFTSGSTNTTSTGRSAPRVAGEPGCGRFEAELCRMYQRIAVSGKPDAAARTLLEARSPSAVGDRIRVPTLIVQGQRDSLFPLDQADQMARVIRASGAAVAVDWVAGGHDAGVAETDRLERRTIAWFDRYLKRDQEVSTGPAFRISRTGGVDSTNGTAQLRGASAERYPGLSAGTRQVALTGREQLFANPAGGSPPALSALPGLSGALGQLSSLGAGFSLDFPGQYAQFDSAPFDEEVRITGSPTARLSVRSGAADGSAVLFAKLYDVAPDGQRVLPGQLVAPFRVEDARQGSTVEVRLPAVDHAVAAGHRLRLVVAATDLGYASPTVPADYTVALEGGLAVPVFDGLRTSSAGYPWWTWGLPLAGTLLAAALGIGARRSRRAPAPDPALAEVPLEIVGLTKRYAKSVDRYAVRELSFRVEKGQVLGLLGPNGAGKTTTLRMLMGLIRPDSGEIRVFGHAIRPGAPVLSRVGAFVEGAGFLPHLSGRANLELYWQATGRPAEDAQMERALEIAGLGDALERAVRTYSQGMRQRLAIAQAMLGMPDLLILDEPTNGLDPPQIREMREVMIRYAAGGRTVIVSSHLLSEVEQSCTHLVVMDRGRLVQAGPVQEIIGGGDTLVVTLSEPVGSGLPEGVPSHSAHCGESREVLAEKVAALEGVSSARVTDEGLLVQLDAMSATALIGELVRMGAPLSGVGPHRRLEDAFLTLIGGPA